MDLSKALQGASALGNDPSSFTDSLQYLRGVDKDGIEEVGEERVRGVETTRYRVEIDLAALRTKSADADLGSDAVALRMSMDYFDFGAAVHADAPPASEVFDASDLMSSATSEFQGDREPAPSDG